MAARCVVCFVNVTMRSRFRLSRQCSPHRSGHSNKQISQLIFKQNQEKRRIHGSYPGFLRKFLNINFQTFSSLKLYGTRQLPNRSTLTLPSNFTEPRSNTGAIILNTIKVKLSIVSKTSE